MFCPLFELKIGRLLLHNKEQWDLKKYPLLCGHWDTTNKCKRLFCIGKIEGHDRYEKRYNEQRDPVIDKNSGAY